MSEKYPITIGKFTCEVSQEEYEIHHEEREHSKYLFRVKREYITLSYQNLDGEETSGDDVISDIHQDSVEDVAVGNVMVEKLREIMPQLTNEESELIHSLFFVENMTERTLSKITGIPLMTINNRKRRILTKLKKLLEN